MFVRRRSRFSTCLNASGGRRDEFARDFPEVETIEIKPTD
jgi:hypothetical protein